MKKIVGIFLIVAFLAVAGRALAAPTGPAPAYYVFSENPVLMALFGVNHKFDGVFSTELSPTQLGLAKRLGVKTKPVQIYRIVAKPTCNYNEACEPELGENPSCPDCKNNGEEEPTPTPTEGPTPTPTPTPAPEGRSCSPGNQIPWGIVKVNGGSGGAGIMVAVLDTGVDTDHLDLVGNIEYCVTKVTHFRPDIKSCEDGNGHGTHVSGTVLANTGSDGLGIYGVAPEAELMAVKVCDKRGWCYGDDMAAGIRYAADNGANIISMSIGGNTEDTMVKEAITYAVGKGVLVVAAAGNDGPADGSIDYPGANVKVMAAGAIDVNGVVPDWSSRGINDGDYIIEEREVEFGAPGVSVESTYNDGCYASGSGTSMATPHVSGLAAKLWQGNASDTRTYLQERAKLHDLHTAGDDMATGFGLPVAP